MPSGSILCDGCGQAADQPHLTRRLKRLESMTRYRPIHVQALFLAAVSPPEDTEHLYSAETQFRGEGAALLWALGIETEGRSVGATLADFQRRGYLLTHFLECPAIFQDADERNRALKARLAATTTRMRRSLKPKRVVVLGKELDPLVADLAAANLAAELVVAENGGAFRLDQLEPGALVTAVTAAATPSL